jgi:membrane fusion protein, multidrug efflux system
MFAQRMNPARVLTLVIALTVIAGCQADGNTQTSDVQRVRVATATLGPGTPAVRASGLLEAKDQMQLAFKVGGVIARFYVDEGASVKRGQVLASLEQTEVKSQVTLAREWAEKTARDRDRAERLFGDRMITREQVEDARTAAAMAAAQLRTAEFNSGYAEIRAPANGTVLRRLAQERELVPPGLPVLVLSDASRGYVVRAALSDRAFLAVALGDSVNVEFDAYPGRTFFGTVSQLTHAADPRTGTFDAEVKVDPQNAPLASGMVAKVFINPRAGSPALPRVPIGAVIEGDQSRAWLFVVDASGTHVKRKGIDVAFLDGETVAVRSGISAGDRVVTEGAAFIDEISAIHVLHE